jgi:hypothetical protein
MTKNMVALAKDEQLFWTQIKSSLMAQNEFPLTKQEREFLENLPADLGERSKLMTSDDPKIKKTFSSIVRKFIRANCALRKSWFESAIRHPVQPLVKDGAVIRFHGNKIVQFLMEKAEAAGIADPNSIAAMDVSVDDQVQFAQLMGCTLEAFHELCFVPDALALVASEEARKLDPKAKGCRDDGCPAHRWGESGFEKVEMGKSTT